MTSEPGSPRLARTILSLLLPERYRDNQLGDLEEEFRTRGRRDGWGTARRWYWLQAATSLPGSGRLRYREQRTMKRGGGCGWMEAMWHNFRDAVRALVGSPQHTIIATVTLALAIGVNASIFSLVNQVLFVDLPMEDPDEVYWVWSLNTEVAQSDITTLSLADFQDYRERTRAFESLAALQQDQMILTGQDQPERITVARVTANLMRVWGDQPVLGRGFVEGEDLTGAPKVAVITHSMWENRFGSDPDMLGRTIRLNGNEHAIVGVASPRMEVGNLGLASVWIPLEMTTSGMERGRRGSRVGRAIRGAMVTGRLREGVAFAEAQAEGARIGEELAREHPVTNRGWALQVRTTDDSLLGDTFSIVMTLLVLTVGFVLLIACANVANLVLVRASSRMRELALRSALGASRSRLIGQLLTENLLISLAAGGIGVGLAYALLRLLVLITRGQAVLFNISTIDHRVLIFTLLVSMVTPLLFGLLPAWGAVRSNLSDSLRDGERGSESRGGLRTRGVLVVSQVALALSLMIVSAVLARSVIVGRQVELGFEEEGVLSMVLQLPDTRYDAAASGRFFDELEERVAALPAVQSVAFAGARPRLSLAGGTPFAIEGRDGVAEEDLPTAYTEVVCGDYFEVLRIPLVRGRTFDLRDRPESSPVALISREAADRFWPEEVALGRRVRIGVEPSAPWREIIGVVENIVGGSDPSNTTVPQIYVPAPQAPRSAMVLMARANGDEGSLTGAIRQEVRAIDPEQPVDDIRSMADYVYDMNSFDYAVIALFVTFALFALAMAAMGIYGVMSYMVSQRSREIGVRIALGAERTSVLRMVLAQGGRLLLLGSVIGLVIGFLMSRLTASLVVGVGPNDPLIFIGVPFVLLVIAFLANFIPAHRATGIDPMEALRAE